MLELAGDTGWRPPIVRTVATTGDGVDELWDAIGAHRAHLESNGDDATRRRERLRGELRALVAEQLLDRRGRALSRATGSTSLVDDVVAGDDAIRTPRPTRCSMVTTDVDRASARGGAATRPRVAVPAGRRSVRRVAARRARPTR